MVKTFKPVISANFLKMLEDSRVGKALIEVTGFSVYKMLTRFSLNLPTLSNPTGWSLDCYDVKLTYNQPDVILFLKYAWLYSETETNEHIDNLIHAVAQDITGFEKNLSIEDGQRKLNETTKILKNQEGVIVQKNDDIRAAHDELEKTHLELETKKTQISQQEKKLRQTCKELEVKLQKEKETSIRNSKSASEPRGCEEVNEYLEELVQKNPKKGPAELWKLIPKGRNGSDVLIEFGKITHEECGCTHFGKKAFYARIQKN
ncbi:Structural maintenance of chromosomes protein 6 [Candidatus Protochlamydia naegleriophila]|uniref:Structural maintenance of chromosomes protein 6 n=1 Tax=Candidatus Protochlamydia naegleriophila TaxID=389348 RepID=A0A0U5EUU7_9BACT|nr:hypothetical protein [Candidatus Protochlamydia naegleriophila]CUI18035.1 Structural maintenance of chromosomes protein 6 [Candidatus Protochlamydia naegleriophila]